ncbi:TPA: restriction endonuclease subunit S [Vibrio vulnificus]|nr:restriction endonuclease subunit S [Vibrio vulnificus]HDY8169657.1 restriction endonuclease subunit S [Vibrio vulnificus]
MIKLGCNESLPLGWKWVEAGSVIDVRDGTHDSPKPVEKGIPLVTSKNLKNGLIDFSTCSFISEEDHVAISKRSSVENGDILYAMIGTIGSPVIVNTTQSFSIKNVALFKFGASEVHNRYFYHFLSSSLVEQQFEKTARGGTQKFVSLGNIRALQVPLPSLDEQKRIAAILDKADAIRQKRKQAIALADEFLRSVFLEMFGDPVTNPKGWEVKSLGSMILKGPTNGLYKPSSSYGSGCRILRIDGFYDGELVGEEKLKRVELSEDELVKYLLPARSVVINRVNSPEYLGKCAFVENLSESTVFESNVMNFIVDENLINPRFLVMQLQMPNIKKQIQTRAKHAVNQSSINQQDVRGFDLLVPPINLQNKYESIVEALKKNRNSLVDHQDKSCGLFSSLSHKAFSGQL